MCVCARKCADRAIKKETYLQIKTQTRSGVGVGVEGGGGRVCFVQVRRKIQVQEHKHALPGFISSQCKLFREAQSSHREGLHGWRKPNKQLLKTNRDPSAAEEVTTKKKKKESSGASVSFAGERDPSHRICTLF